MRYSAASAVILLLCSYAFPGFSFLHFANGSASGDSDDYYRFSQPSSLFISKGSLYASDTGKGMLHIMNISGNLSRIKAVNSPSGQPLLSNPMHMDFDLPSGVLYIAGGTSGDIITYSGVGSTVDRWNPTGTTLQKASGVVLFNDTIYVTDATRGLVLEYSRATKSYIRIVAQQGGSDGQLTSPQDIVYHNGKFYVSDSGKGLIFVYDRNFIFQNATFGRGKGGVYLSSPRGMDFDGNRLYVADSGKDSVVAFSLDGYPVDILNSSTAWGNLSYPEDVVVDNGVLYVADTGNKLVKAFEIVEGQGNPEVEKMIAEAKLSCAGLQSLYSVAGRLNVTYTPLSSDAEIASAQDYYDAYQFSSASSIAAKAKSDCESSQSSIVQGLDLKVKQLMSSSQAKVAPYRNFSSTNLTLLVQFDNKASAASFALSSKSYSAAADAALSLPSLADAIIFGSESKEAAEAEKKQNQSAAYAAAEITAVLGQLDRLQEKSDQYRQGINLTGVRTLVSLAKESAQKGDFDSANRSLELALVEMGTYQAALDAIAKEIDSAQQSISSLDLEFGAVSSKATLVAPDLAKERQMMAQAKEALYSSPQVAVQMASQAKASAEAKSRDAQAISLALVSVCVVMFFISLIALGFFLHLRGRRHREE
jgi:DNA-binding beta-propeller fold protein YncE